MSTANWRLSINTDTDVAYIRMASNDVAETLEVTDEVLVDVDEHNVVVGIEMLRLDAQIPFTDLTRLVHVHSEDLAFLESLMPSVRARMVSAADGVNAVASRSAVHMTDA